MAFRLHCRQVHSKCCTKNLASVLNPSRRLSTAFLLDFALLFLIRTNLLGTHLISYLFHSNLWHYRTSLRKGSEEMLRIISFFSGRGFPNPNHFSRSVLFSFLCNLNLKFPKGRWGPSITSSQARAHLRLTHHSRKN
jgi:hypothetical protein